MGPGPGRVRMTIVESASAASLSAVVTEHVARGATVYTDGWKVIGALITLPDTPCAGVSSAV